MSVNQTTFRLSTLEDVKYLAHRLRYEDMREIYANTGRTPYQSLYEGFFHCDLCFTITTANKPVSMFGVAKHNMDIGVIWLMATDDITNIKFPFLRECREVIEEINKHYKILWNFVDCRNELHIKWLKWCGFKFLRKINYGNNKLPFYEFVRICVNQ